MDLQALLKGKVESAYIFGSFNTPEFNADSDLDLILVCNTDRLFVERPLDFPEILSLNFEVDLLVYTPEEFEKISKEENKVGFWKSAFSQMQKII
ncbi:MAG: nucleotidyltransferase domain-containing protein [Bacteriovoracaceae bacterium]|nr:nucleotidyltransferase domain-containing protein [Bacteriovoracaceae bacterium]